MNNIFENAYFGKAQKTRDGRQAIYTIMSCGSHWLTIQDTSFTWEYNDNGKLASNIDNALDIVSEWEETINEEELDRLAEEYIQGFDYAIEISPNLLSLKKDRALAKSMFKVGYKAAKKGE